MFVIYKLVWNIGLKEFQFKEFDNHKKGCLNDQKFQ